MWEDRNYIQFAITAGFIILLLVFRSITNRIVKRHARINDFHPSRILYTIKFFNFIWFITFGTLIAITWDISFNWLSVYLASFFTVTGVALFAQWSILSNITASVILFFNYPIRIGSKIKIADGDNSVSGTVKDITLFSIRIKTEEGELITYPNNLAIQKPIVQMEKNPK